MTDADGSRQIIRQMLRFMRSGLGLEE